MFGDLLSVEKKYDGTMVWCEIDKMLKDDTLICHKELFRISPGMHTVNVKQAHSYRDDHSFGQVRARILLRERPEDVAVAATSGKKITVSHGFG